MIDDVFLPAVVFVHNFLLGKVVPLPAHVGKAQTEAALGVLVEGDFRPRAELIQNVAEEGIIDGGLALHDGIVVVEDKTGVFQHRSSPNIFIFSHYTRRRAAAQPQNSSCVYRTNVL